MRVIVDTNVVLDVLLDRRPFSATATQVFILIEHARAQAVVCATTITTIDYLLGRSLPRAKARQALSSLLSLFDIAPVNRQVIEAALRSRLSDFEDAIVEQAGLLANAQAIVTRNSKDFVGGQLKVLDPSEFLALMET